MWINRNCEQFSQPKLNKSIQTTNIEREEIVIDFVLRFVRLRYICIKWSEWKCGEEEKKHAEWNKKRIEKVTIHMINGVYGPSEP